MKMVVPHFTLLLAVLSSVSANFTTFGTTTALLSTEPTPQENTEIRIDQLSLTEICMIVGVPPINCTCESFPDFCLKKEDKYSFTCSTITDKIEGSVKIISSSIGLIGNYIVLHVTFINRKNIGRYRILIALLALYDFIFSVISLLTGIPLLWTCKWVYGPAMCTILRPALNFGGIVALGTIVIIAIERYYGIVKHFEKRFFLNNILFANLFNIVVCIGMVIPLFITSKIDNDGNCREEWSDKKNGSLIYSWFLLIATFIAPLIVVSMFYYKIIMFLHQQLVKTTGILTTNQQQTLTRLKDFRRITKILVAILIAYFVLVLPNRIIWVILDHLKDKNLNVVGYRIAKYLALFPYYFHVAINPIIYSAIDKGFRAEVMSALPATKYRAQTLTSSSSIINETIKI